MSEEELINYFQEKINNGNNKIFTDISDYEYKTVDAINCINDLLEENQQLKQSLNKQMKETSKENLDCSKYAVENNDLKEQIDLYKSVIDKLEKWLKEDLGVTYTAESMSGKIFTTAKEAAVRDVLKKINELKGVDE